MKLAPKFVEKPWGRTGLAAVPPELRARRIGEIWFEAPDGGNLPLLVKHLFTDELLSVQVHPDDAQAKARGLPSGKSECWYILDAVPGATLALGLKRPASAEEVRAAALDGTIEGLLHWQKVRPGDFFYVPAGTIHAIGPGISLVEVQQPADVTFRLFDYGRPRDLHLSDALDVAARTPYPPELIKRASPDRGTLFVGGPHFTLIAAAGRRGAGALAERDRFAFVLEGTASVAGKTAGPADCLFVPRGAELDCSADAALLIAAAGAWTAAEASPPEAERRRAA
ncbi:MAG TPA: class I mannose-6-phosphate isomerase [Allosphingosinicella sp.]|nr:class I mannose-6-phosphate isomerase [Allosphingosinicella sp.]